MWLLKEKSKWLEEEVSEKCAQTGVGAPEKDSAQAHRHEVFVCGRPRALAAGAGKRNEVMPDWQERKRQEIQVQAQASQRTSRQANVCIRVQDSLSLPLCSDCYNRPVLTLLQTYSDCYNRSVLTRAHTEQTLDEVDESAQEWEAERASFRQRCERWAKEGEERESRHAAQEEWMRLHV